jgi:copper homeostasis protein
VTILEACVDSTEAASLAVAAGADRVELCANLVEGGTTPSLGSIARAVVDVGGDVMVMIRPRGGDFVYGRRELDIMERDIDAAQQAGAAGVVFGCLTPEGDIDRDLTRKLIDKARPMQVTFHRAFDVCRDADEGLAILRDLGVDRLLTSGQQPTAPEGLDLIARLVDEAGDDLVVMPGVGLTPANIADVAAATAAREFHVYTERTRPSPMEFRKAGIPMGRSYEPDEYVILEPDTEQITAMAAVIRPATDA